MRHAHAHIRACIRHAVVHAHALPHMPAYMRHTLRHTSYATACGSDLRAAQRHTRRTPVTEKNKGKNEVWRELKLRGVDSVLCVICFSSTGA
jgi:hypothetical protein